ncbi:MAG: peptidase M16, partial [Desulfovibrionaceae bacterium CG1_02_65_16]
MRRILSWLLVLLVLTPAAGALAAKKHAPQTPPPAPAAAVAASPVAVRADSKPAVPGLPDSAIKDVTCVRLKNGLTVLVKQDDRFPLAHIRMLVHAGSAYETRAQAGISHVLEHMVFKGAGDMKPGEVARRIEDVGGSLNAATSFDDTVFHVEVPDTSWKLGLSVVADMTFKPTLDPAQLKSEKEVVLAELKRGEDSPGSMLFQTLQGMVFEGGSYQWPIIGYRDTVRAVTSDSLRAYIAPLYQPQNMLLCVVGRVKPAEVIAEADRLLGGIRNIAPITPPTPFALKKDGGPRLTIVPGMWNKVHLGLAFPAPDFLSGKMAALDMLAQILGGDETSRLYREFKYEKRLVDSINVGVSNLERGGILMVSATLDADKLPVFWDQLTTELAGFDAHSITDQEITRARTNIEADIFLARETIGGLASKLARQYAFEGGQEGEANYLAAVAGMDKNALAAAYREFFRPEALSAAILAPKGVAIDKAPLLASLQQHWPAAPAAAAATGPANGTAIRQVALPGGGVLVLQPDATLPYAAVNLAWTGGDALLEPSEQGLGALAASLITRGTTARTANQVEDFLSDHAAALSASTGTETFTVGAKFPTRFAPEMFGLLDEMLTRPAFAAGELARAKEDQQNAIKRGEDQPLGLAFRKLPGVLFASAPYNYQRLGDPA